MADIISTTLTGALTGAGAIASGIKMAGTIFLFLSPLLIGVGVFFYLRSFKHRIILRKKTKTSTDIITETKFKIIKRKGEADQILLLKGRKKLPVPPQDSIEITEKGRYFVEVYYSESAEASWLNIQYVPVTAKESLGDIKFNSISSNDKSFYFNREKIANSKYNQENIWSFLNKNAGGIVVIIVVGLLVFFWGDIMKPAVDLHAQNVEISNNQLRAMELTTQALDKATTILEERYIIIPGNNQTIPNAPGTRVAPE